MYSQERVLSLLVQHVFWEHYTSDKSVYTICPYIRDKHIYKRLKLVSNMLTFNVRKYVVSKIKVDYFWILNKHGYQVSYRQNIREVNKTSFALICMISTKVFFFNTPLTESRTLSYQISAIHRISKRVIPIRVLIQISHVLYHTSQLHCPTTQPDKPLRG